MTPISDGAAPTGDGEQPEGRIVFKDNRKIDATTGKVRGQAAGAPAEPVIDGGEAGGPAGAPSSADADAARQEAAERTADLQRLSAEYANYRKRVDRDKQVATANGKAAVLTELLAICDDLERAAEHGDLTGGFKTVADKFTETLSRLGLAHYGAEGDEFDPNLHEAVQFTESADVSVPTVAAVLRRGYLFGEKVLRAAVVAVAGPAAGSVGGADTADAAGAAGDDTGADAVGADDAAADADEKDTETA